MVAEAVPYTGDGERLHRLAIRCRDWSELTVAPGTHRELTSIANAPGREANRAVCS